MRGHPGRSEDVFRAMSPRPARARGAPPADPRAAAPVLVPAAAAARAANAGGFGLAETLALAAEFLADPGVRQAPPVALMTYLNPMMRFGFEKLAAEASAAGVSGFIVPDLPPDNPMSARWLRATGPRGLQTVFLVAPTSPPDRIATVAEASRGFIYVVSSLGVTGERPELPSELSALVTRVKSLSAEVPVAVGFGVSTPEQAAEVARVADGVIVGSAIVRRQGDPSALRGFVQELAEAVHGAR